MQSVRIGPVNVPISKYQKRPVFWVLVLALCLRIVVCFTSHTINPDGIGYVYQAQAAYQMEFSAIADCRLKFVTLQPFLIAAVFPFTGDWVAAGLTISVIFSMASLVCIYMLGRRFFDEVTSCLLLLVYAMIPIFVKRSAEILRDPVYWFFMTFGMLAFISIYDQKKTWFDGFRSMASSTLFIVAASLRIEGVIFIIGSGMYLLLARHESKPRQLIFFCLPFMLICASIALFILMSDNDVLKLFKLDKLLKESSGFIAAYDSIDQFVRHLMSQHDGMERRFLRRLGEVLWIVPIGSIINRIGEGLFYPYVVFYLLGFAGIRKRVKTCTTIRYFLWLSWFSLLVVYLHIINTWFVSTRFLASFFLPSFIVIGFGLENITTFFQVKRKMARKAIITFLAVYILVWGIGRNVRYHYTERLPYKQAGTIIEQKRAPDAIEKIVARRSKAAEYTHFYAHRHCARPVCTASNLKNIPPSYSELIDLMTHRNIRYLIYESNTWPHSHFDFLSSTYHDDFNVLGQWESNDKEKLLLLELKAADLLRTG